MQFDPGIEGVKIAQNCDPFNRLDLASIAENFYSLEAATATVPTQSSIPALFQ